MVNANFVCGLVQPQSEDALFRRRMLRRSSCMRFSVLMLSRLTVRTLTEWFWLHAFMICLHLSEIWRLLNWEVDPMIWLWLMCKESLLGHWDAWSQKTKKSRFVFCCEQIFEEVIVLNPFAKIRSLSEEASHNYLYLIEVYKENSWVNSFNNLRAFNRISKRISLSEEYVQYSIMLNCNANKISLRDETLSEFYCIQTAVQSHILSDDDL